jgi:hypothetical protein
MLVPAEARVGDCVALVRGSEVPFIVRRSEKGLCLLGMLCSWDNGWGAVGSVWEAWVCWSY